MICRVNSSAAQSRHSFRWSLGRCRSGSLRTVGANLWQYFSHFCDSHERTNVYPGECHIVASCLALGLSIVSNMYRFARGTIFSARTFLPSMSGTQPVSSNISEASSTCSASSSLVVSLIMTLLIGRISPQCCVNCVAYPAWSSSAVGKDDHDTPD